MSPLAVIIASSWGLVGLAILLKLPFIKALRISQSHLALLFSVKVVAAFALQAIFTYHYTDRSTADIYRFFDDGLILSDIAYENPLDFVQILTGLGYSPDEFRLAYFDQMNAWIKPYESGFGNDNRFMIKVNAVFALVSGGLYEVHGVLFTFCSFLGMLLAARAICPANCGIGLWIATLFPSALIWTSGGLKESAVMFGIGLFTYGLHQIIRHQRNVKNIFMVVLGAIVLLQIKVYFLLAMIPAILAVLVRLQFNMAHRWSWALWMALLLSGAALASLIGLDIPSEVARKQLDFVRHAHELNSGSMFEMQPIQSSWISMLQFLPDAIYNSALRPLPWQVRNIGEALMCLENFMLLSGLIVFAFRRKRIYYKQVNMDTVLQFCLIIYALIGLTTPVLGAIMRYKAPLVLILILTIVPSIFQSSEHHETSH